MGMPIAGVAAWTSRACHSTRVRTAEGMWGEALLLLQLGVADVFGSVDFQTMWKALKSKVGSRKAWPLARLIVGAFFNN